ncbi:hypothetical protein CTAYLR_000922 [Chrysophaeum taylorii]|uniref:Fibronectin type-III domain-containing protein n=1 Tax=Chrysophaeum taylorii TaxID=2483200 RepID=A0AAD7UF92_9STRA|nr:hypothetical protein CTAYLR_000922 [Chrysophaeum taylorii]
MERLKYDALLHERLAQEAEVDLMQAEEKLSWDAYELSSRNRARLARRHEEAERENKEQLIAKVKADILQKEEGFTFHNGVLKEFMRWRDSPALSIYFEGHKGEVYAFKVSDAFDCVLSASADTTLRLWDLSTGKCIRGLEGHGKAVRDCDLSPGFSLVESKGLAVSGSSDKTVRIWDMRRGVVRKELRAHTAVVYASQFSPDGRHVCSASADRTVRLWHALQGYLVFVFEGHASPVVSAAFSSSGRYVVSASDYGERAIKLWTADVPETASVTPMAWRVQWTRSGLVKRMTLIKDPPKSLLNDPRFLDQSFKKDRIDPWRAISDGEDEVTPEERAAAAAAAAKVARRENNKVSNPQDEDDEEEEMVPIPDAPEAAGFSLSVVSLDRFGRETRAESYYDRIALRIVLCGVERIGQFFVAVYKKRRMHDSFSTESGARCGAFERSVPFGTRLTCGGAAAVTSDKRFSPTSHVAVRWTAPACGTGTVVVRATVMTAGERPDVARLSYTLREVSPPPQTTTAGVLDAERDNENNNMFGFKASVLHQIFIELVRNRHFAEAANMLDVGARLKVRGGDNKNEVNAAALFFRGRDKVMAEVKTYMANGISIVKDAKDLEPGKSISVVLHGRPFEAPPNEPLGEAPGDEWDDLTPLDPQTAKSELMLIARLRKARYACAEEVRTLPSNECTDDEQLPSSPVQPTSMIADGKFGGTLPHLRMPLPAAYPRSLLSPPRRSSDASPPKELLRAPPYYKALASWVPRFGARRDREALAQLQKFSAIAETEARRESTKRRTASVTLPGFEIIASDLAIPRQVRASAAAAGVGEVVPDSPTLRDVQALGETSNITPQSELLPDGSSEATTTTTTTTMGLRRRRNMSFPTLPGFAVKATSKIAKKQAKELQRARVTSGCLRTFWVATPSNGKAHHHTINQVAWSLDEMRIASCSTDKTVRLWTPQTGRLVQTLDGHDDAVLGVAFSEDGLRLVSCGMDNVILLWNVVSGDVVRKFRGHDDAVFRCVLLRNASAMLSCSSDKTLKSWFLTPNRPDAPPRCVAHDGGQTAAVVSWRAPPAYNEEITAYKIQYRVGLREPFAHETTVDGTTFKKKIENLLPGQHYQFRVCAVNRMGQGEWCAPSKQHLTRAGLPPQLAQPIVLRRRSTPTSVSMCWRASTATAQGTAIYEFHVEGEGMGMAFGEGPSRTVDWRDAATFALQVEPELEAQVAEEADVWRRTGPASRGKCSPVVDATNNNVLFLEKNSATARRSMHRRVRARKREKEKVAERARRQQAKRLAAMGHRCVLMAFEFSDLKPGYEWRFRVRAVSAVGEGPFSPPTYSVATPPAVPDRPSPPTGVAVSMTTIQVSWTTPRASGSAVERFELEDGDNKRASFGRRVSTTSIDELKPGRRYTFRVRAWNAVGSSAWSAWCDPVVTLTGVPDTPARPVVVEATITSLALVVAKPENAGKILSHLVFERRELRPGGVKSEWASPVSVAPPPGPPGLDCRVLIDHLHPDTVYQVRCAAANANGVSAWSLPSLRGRTLPARPPTAPADPRPAARFATFCDLVWTGADPRGAAVTGHLLHLKRLRRAHTHFPDRPADADGTLSHIDVGYLPRYRVDNLEPPPIAYIFRVAAINSVAQGPFSYWSLPFSCADPS